MLNNLLNHLDYDEGIRITCPSNDFIIFINKNINNEFIIQKENKIQKNQKEILYFGQKKYLINFLKKTCTGNLDIIEY